MNEPKGMLIKRPVPTLYTIVQHSFQLTFRKRRMLIMSSLLLFISRAWDVHLLFVFAHDSISFFYYSMEILPIVVSIVIE